MRPEPPKTVPVQPIQQNEQPKTEPVQRIQQPEPPKTVPEQPIKQAEPAKDVPKQEPQAGGIAETNFPGKWELTVENAGV